MRVSLSLTDQYIPEWRGNRDLPDDEQIKVTYRLMTAEQEEKYSTLYMRRGTGDDYSMDVKTHAVEIWDECVTTVTGLVGDSGPITDPKQVRAIPGIYGLVTEVVAVIKRGISEDELKN